MSYTILKPNLNRKIKGVLFDMDGLLLDTERLYVENWMIASKEAGFPMTFLETLGLRSLNLQERQIYLESIKGPNIKDEPIRKRMDELTHDYILKHGATPKKGAIELLDYLNSHGIPCAITTSSLKERALANLEPIGLASKFKAICSGRNLPHGKPYPDIYLYGAKMLNLDPRDCLALEDSKAGIIAGYRANCLPIVIPDLDEPDQEILDLSYAKADSLLDIITIIKTLNGD